MYDIIYISPQKTKDYSILKKRLPLLKFAKDIEQAKNLALTDFYYLVFDDLLVDDNFVFDYEVDDWSKDYVHVFKNGNYYDGIALIPKTRNISSKEVEHRFFVNRKEVDIQASVPKPFDLFYVDTYNDYLFASENSSTQLFWVSSKNIQHNKELVNSYYITHHESQLRKQNHAWITEFGAYNGLFLCSKNKIATQKEIDFRFLVNKIEHNDTVGSTKTKYDVFTIDSYEDYIVALENSETEMFWGDSNNILSNIPDLYFPHDNEYDRKTNHNFIHCDDKRNGLFLFSKHSPVTEREIEYRFIVNAKEWNIVASQEIEYPVFEIDSYDEYLQALEESKTEMFWMSSANIKADIPNIYFTHDNEYDRKRNHAFIHRVQDNNLYNGLFLCSKHRPLTQKEVEFRHIVDRKEWDIIGSTAIEYDVFDIDSYEDYLYALDNSKTEMFWMSSANIKADIPNLYFTHDNTYDRKTNHNFIHCDDKRNGLFLLSKHTPVTKKEIEHRFLVNAKEWNIKASGPLKYDIFYPKTYEDYLNALENSKTEMFWIIPDYVNPTDRFKFDTYFTHDETYNREINHVYLNGKYHDGIVLCSKKSKFSKREFDYKFIAAKKEVPVVISTPLPYDIVFISYQEKLADQNYQRLLTRFPNAKRVHGVKGIHQAHIEAAKQVDTHMFWIVDGDAIVLDEFKFDYQCAQWDKDTVHVWRSINPVNDLVYGYGGVKLFPTELTINMDTSKPDMTTSISDKFKAVGEMSVLTGFNTDPFETWKSAFRECCKLSSKVIDRQQDKETDDRLFTWTNVGADRKFGSYAIAGAKAGKKYGEQNKGNIEALRKINDFDWLKEQFDATA